MRRRRRVTRRDLLLQVAELDRHARAVERAGRGRGLAGRSVRSGGSRPGSRARAVADDAAARNSTDPRIARAASPPLERHPLGQAGVWARAAAQSQATAAPPPVDSVQLTLDLGDEPAEGEVSGLPEMTPEERMRAELEILGLDASRHVVDSYADVPRRARRRPAARTCSHQRSKSELLVAGVKVATQTPPIRSGRRVIFLTLDDATGPVDATFFEDAQGPYAATVFDSWLLVVRGELRRTGRRGVSLRATGCLGAAGAARALAALTASTRCASSWPWCPRGSPRSASRPRRAAESRSTRPVMASRRLRRRPTASGHCTPVAWAGAGCWCTPAASRCRPTPTSSRPVRTTKDVARKLWHRSPGSAG